ncbi:hypothetical protein INT43_000940 [Umbelopsis isabellina]|uniref:High-affinity nicotinic acid transporter n=1 Tax=Mortierella isabellina TaxID=91625 RepID=A0A8H7Q315_MORIS|nr:hypothetical protein INT43_000940 [Umbelopsis isabellina]
MASNNKLANVSDAGLNDYHANVSHVDERTSQRNNAMEKALVRKLDTKLLPYLCLMYLFAALDRSSLGNAVLDNFEEDLELKPGQFNTAIMIFYAGFLLFQVPSNILLKRYTAKRCKAEIATRIALFYSTSVLSHSFAGILAYYILRLRGASGLAGWQWLFIIEGLPTIAIAIMAFWYLPESPQTCPWLSEEERVLAVTRLTSGDAFDIEDMAPHEINKRNRQEIYEAIIDWKVWLWMLMFFCGSVPNTSVSNFLPIIIKGLGFDDKLAANLMSAPPYMFAAVVMIYMAHSSDKKYERAYHAIVGASLCFTGYLLLLLLTDRSTPSMKRSVATAMAVSANNSAGLLGSHIYKPDDSPRYLRGHSVNLGFISLFMILTLVQRYLLKRQNRIKAVLRESGEHQTLLEQPINRKLIGDRQLNYEYAL